MTIAELTEPEPPQVEGDNFLNLLIVDDERAIREACREVADSMGFRTVTADSAEHAYRVLEAQAIDVVLLDLRLPGAGGLDALDGAGMEGEFPALQAKGIERQSQHGAAFQASGGGGFRDVAPETGAGGNGGFAMQRDRAAESGGEAVAGVIAAGVDTGIKTNMQRGAAGDQELRAGGRGRRGGCGLRSRGRSDWLRIARRLRGGGRLGGRTLCHGGRSMRLRAGGREQ